MWQMEKRQSGGLHRSNSFYYNFYMVWSMEGFNFSTSLQLEMLQVYYKNIMHFIVCDDICTL